MSGDRPAGPSESDMETVRKAVGKMCLCCRDNRHYRALIARALGLPYEPDDIDPDMVYQGEGQ